MSWPEPDRGREQPRQGPLEGTVSSLRTGGRGAPPGFTPTGGAGGGRRPAGQRGVSGCGQRSRDPVLGGQRETTQVFWRGRGWSCVPTGRSLPDAKARGLTPTQVSRCPRASLCDTWPGELEDGAPLASPQVCCAISPSPELSGTEIRCPCPRKISSSFDLLTEGSHAASRITP